MFQQKFNKTLCFFIGWNLLRAYILPTNQRAFSRTNSAQFATTFPLILLRSQVSVLLHKYHSVVQFLFEMKRWVAMLAVCAFWHIGTVSSSGYSFESFLVSRVTGVAYSGRWWLWRQGVCVQWRTVHSGLHGVRLCGRLCQPGRRRQLWNRRWWVSQIKMFP